MSAAMQGLTENQKDVARVVERFAEKFKVDVVLYESDLNSDTTLPNGQYDGETNTVYLDVMGGANSAEDAANLRKNGTLGNAMVQYLGHELTHALEAGSAEGYAAYRQAVRESMRKRGQSYEALVRARLEQAARAGQKLTLGGAEAEVIANASEFMLENTEFISNAPGSVKNRVKKVISDFAKKVRAFFATLTGGSRESQSLRELKNNMYRYVDNLQKLWDVAAMEMVEGAQNATETQGTAQNVQESQQYAMRDTEYLNAVEAGDIEEAQKMVDEAAREAGYVPIKLYHGTERFGFTEFDVSKSDDKMSIFVTDERHIAETYSGEGANSDLRKAFKGGYDEFTKKSIVELEPYFKEYIDTNIRVSTESEGRRYTDERRAKISSATDRLFDYADENVDELSDKMQREILKIISVGDKLAGGGEVSEKAGYDLRQEIIKAGNRLYEESVKTRTEQMFYEMATEVDEITQNAKALLKAKYGGLLTNDGTGTFMYAQDVMPVLANRVMKGIYELYGNRENLLEIDADGSNWNGIDGKLIGRDGGQVTTREVAAYAKENGYSGVSIKNVVDIGPLYQYKPTDRQKKNSNLIVYFDNTSVKSAAPVTYDNEGKVIPLSERFNPEQQDIRFALREVDGQQVVWVEENILDQREDGESVASFVQRYIKSHIGELYTIIESGSKVYLGENLPGEYTHSKYTDRLYSHRRDLYSIKMQAAQNLGELIEIASNRRWERTKHQHNKDAKYGIYKYDSRIAFPAGNKVKAYTVELLILNASDGKKYLYDVQNIKKNTAVASALYFKGRGRSVEASPRTSGVLTDNVSQTAETVNSERQNSLRDNQTQTEEFKRWFGNSEVTDEDGNPLVVYHTTRDTFYTFDKDFLGRGADKNASDGYLASTAHVGFWFNTRKLTAKGMGDNAMPVYLSAQRLYEAGTLDGLTEEIWDAYDGEYDTEDPSIEDATAAGENFRSYLESRGYDGIMVDDTEVGGTSYIVFEPEQIKSATDNVGTFDPQNPDIRYARRDDLTMADVREILSGMEVTKSMNATEKDMLTRYKAKLLVVQDLQIQIDQQKAIIDSETATTIEKSAATARMRIYTEQQRRAQRYLRTAEGSNGFARLMATSQELARRLTADDAENAVDSLETEIGELTERLDATNRMLEQTRETMKNAEIRAMFDPNWLYPQFCVNTQADPKPESEVRRRAGLPDRCLDCIVT